MNKSILSKLSLLGTNSIDLEQLLVEIKREKEISVQAANDIESKEYWNYEQIAIIHKDYLEAYKLIKDKEYYKGWCKLENIEISLQFLKPHFPIKTNPYKLLQIEKNVKNLQAIYPYRMFSSIEMIMKEVKCNICDKVVSFRNPCNHKIGEIYNGEMCLRIVTKSEPIGIAIVENPVNKYTVLFMKENEEGKTVDHYDYTTLEYLFDVILHPFEKWDLVIHEKYSPHKNFRNLKPDDKCSCNSTKKYSECCLKKKGVKYLHYEFLFSRHIDKRKVRSF
jgi:hypothetical protein